MYDDATCELPPPSDFRPNLISTSPRELIKATSPSRSAASPTRFFMARQWEDGASLTLFCLMALCLLCDLIADWKEPVSRFHVGVEMGMVLLSSSAIFYLFKKMKVMRARLKQQSEISAAVAEEAAMWKSKNDQVIRGLSQAIDEQLLSWKLTHTERDVALFLLKGFSTSEIALYRHNSEKTIKQHCTAIYAKSRLKGRAELSAFFLEDLLSQSGHLSEKSN